MKAITIYCDGIGSTCMHVAMTIISVVRVSSIHLWVNSSTDHRWDYIIGSTIRCKRTNQAVAIILITKVTWDLFNWAMYRFAFIIILFRLTKFSHNKYYFSTFSFSFSARHQNTESANHQISAEFR